MHELVLARKTKAPPASSMVKTGTRSYSSGQGNSELLKMLNAFGDNVTTSKEQALLDLVKAALHLN